MLQSENSRETPFFRDNKLFGKSIDEIRGYTPPQLHEGKEWYIDFYAYDISSGKMRRKKIKLNRIKGITARRKYARELVAELHNQLRQGWNPWLKVESDKAFVSFDDALDGWMQRMERMLADGVIRKATYDEYSSKSGTLKKYNASIRRPIRFAYQMTAVYVRDFLDHIYIGRKSSARTFNNYVRTLKVICKYWLEYGYITQDPSQGIKAISANKIQAKKRSVISREHLVEIREYLQKENKAYLLACYLTYYCLIRPKELSMLRIADISLARRTIRIRKEVSKNRKEQIVTIPISVATLMEEINISNYPDQYHLFGQHFTPTFMGRSEKVYRDQWITMRRKLGLPESYQFYSLKDTGITDMLRLGIDPITVRDQARHSSIQITDIYTPHDMRKANAEIKELDGIF